MTYVPNYSQPPTAIPQAPALQRRTYASPMSFVGITRRTLAWVNKVGGSSPVAAIAAWSAAALFLPTMYVFLVCWYIVVFGLFGLLMIPWRIIRRGHRKQEHYQQAQLATMQMMMVNQQQAMLHNAGLAPAAVAPPPALPTSQPAPPQLPAAPTSA